MIAFELEQRAERLESPHLHRCLLRAFDFCVPPGLPGLALLRVELEEARRLGRVLAQCVVTASPIGGERTACHTRNPAILSHQANNDVDPLGLGPWHRQRRIDCARVE